MGTALPVTSKTGGASATTLGATAPVSISIAVPQRSAAFQRAYVSSGTKSIVLSVNLSGSTGAMPVVANCTTACSFNINAPVGSDTFAMTMYDGLSGSGNRLSTGQTTQTVSMNQSNTVKLVLGGVIASLAIAVSTVSFTDGTPGAATVTVTSKDATGATIVGPDPFETPISLSTSDASGAFNLSLPTLSTPDAVATLNYVGSASTGTDVTAKLAGTQIAAVVPVKVAAGTSPTVTAAMADTIADAVGADSHFNYTGTPYTTVPAVETMLIASGIRHIRDASPGQSATYTALMTDLYTNHGIDQIGGISLGMSQADVMAYVAANPGVVGFEVGNENDALGGAWATDLQTYLPQLAAFMRTTPSLEHIKIESPSIVNPNDAKYLGDVSSVTDVGSLHESVCGANPGDLVGTGGIGYGGFPFATMDYSLAWEKIINGSNPVWVTEWAYNDSPPPTDCAIPDKYIAVYQPRAIFEWALRGVHRVYTYQLADMPTDPMFGAEGLLRADGSAKPQYTALTNLIAMFSDKGAAFAPAPVPMTFSASSDVHHYVTRKRNGTILIAVWREAQDYLYRTYADANLPAETATVSVGGSFATAKLHVFGYNGNVSDSAVANPASINMSLNAGLQVIELGQ